MPSRKLTFALILGASLFCFRIAVASAKEGADLNSLSDADLKTLTVRFERMGCYGNCPAYAITIHGDGQIEYAGKSQVKTTTAQKGQIDASKIRDIVSEFAKAKFFDFAEDYSSGEHCKRMCTDMASVVTELTVRGATHSVKHYYGCIGAPKSLWELETAIDKLASTEQWTGDVSKQGPFGTTCF